MRRQSALFLAVLLAVLLALPALSAAAAAPVFPPGLRVGLEPAAGLRSAHGFPGFEDSDRQVAVTIFDLPGAAYDKIARSAFAMPELGFTEVGREMFRFVGGVGSLINGRTRKGDTDRHIWFLVARPVAGDVNDLAMLIRVEVPANAREVYSDAVVRKMLASVTLRPSPTEERLGLLPFKFTDLAGFRVIKVTATGAVVLTEGPTDDISKQPYAVVSIARGAPDRSSDHARFARNLLANAPLRDLTMTSADSMRINGSPGFEIRARGANPSGQPVTLVQWLRFGGADSFVRVVAIAHQDDWDRTFNRFRALRDGIELR